jgi:hypothetical protein
MQMGILFQGGGGMRGGSRRFRRLSLGGGTVGAHGLNSPFGHPPTFPISSFTAYKQRLYDHYRRAGYWKEDRRGAGVRG